MATLLNGLNQPCSLLNVYPCVLFLFDISSIREYQDKDGKDKKFFKTIGELIFWENGGASIELYHMPGVKISAFEQKKKDTQESETKKANSEASEASEIPANEMPY